MTTAADGTPEAPNDHAKKWAASVADAGDPATPEEIAAAHQWLQLQPLAANGDDRQPVFDAVMRGFGLDRSSALAVLDAWNKQCSPPLAAPEFFSAMKSGRDCGMPCGCLLAEVGPIVAPPPWPDPVSLDTRLGLPPFPVDALPSGLADWVRAIATATQTPVDLAGMLVLVCIGAAAAKRFEVWVHSYSEPVNLWVIVAMDPSARKSPVFSAATRPLRAWEARSADQLGPEIAKAQAAFDVEEARLRGYKAVAAKAKGEDSKASTLDQVERQAEKVADMAPPVAERLLASDTTPEALNSLLAEQDGRIALMSDEGGMFESFAGRYQGGIPNLDALLQGFSGGDVRVDRKGRPSEFVSKAAISLGLTVQPKVLHDVAANETMIGRGLFARPLFSVPASNVGSRLSAFDVSPVPDELARRYTAIVWRLLGKPVERDEHGRVKPERLEFARDADDVMRCFANSVESRIRPGGELAEIGWWAGKLPGTVCRIAGLLHVAMDAKGPIGPEVASRAVAIGEYSARHALEAFAEMGDGAEVTDARTVLEAVGKRGEQVVTRRKLWASLRRRLHQETSRIDIALALLVDHGYLRIIPGRAVSFSVHPKALEGRE